MILKMIYQFSFSSLLVNSNNTEFQDHSSSVLLTDPEHVGAANAPELRKSN